MLLYAGSEGGSALAHAEHNEIGPERKIDARDPMEESTTQFDEKYESL